MTELTSSTRIRLSQIIDFELWADAFVEDAKHYNIGEISEKTGLQKTLVNGRIVWLLPKQGGGFYQGKMGVGSEKMLAGTAKLARPDGQIVFTERRNIRNDARSYLNHMYVSWKNNPVICPFLNYARVGLNNKSFDHLFKTHGKLRPPNVVKDRAECLPYVRDILQRTGKPADHFINARGEESYSIVGLANINNRNQEVLVVISREPSDNYFYLSVFKIK